MVEITEVTCRTALNPSKIPGVDYCLNPYRGCSHACVYCYAGWMARKWDTPGAWGSFAQAKTEIGARLTGQTRRPKQGVVLLSSVTDPYQDAEERYGLTRSCLQVLAATQLRASILTKSDLVLRDLPLLQGLAGVQVGFSLTTLDEDLAALLEPGAPSPRKRLAALQSLAQAGIPTWVFVAPVIPGLNDVPQVLAQMYRVAKQAGAREVDFDPFNFYPSAVNQVRELIHRYRPQRSGEFAIACREPKVFRQRVRQLVRMAANP